MTCKLYLVVDSIKFVLNLRNEWTRNLFERKWLHQKITANLSNVMVSTTLRDTENGMFRPNKSL